jgi:DNA-binding IclR family transcriptional regulator
VELTSRDEQVLAVLAFRGDASLSEIASELKLPLHLVRGSIERLKRRELVVPRPYLDLYRIGLTEFSFYFSLVGLAAARHAALSDFISQPAITWAVALLDDFELACSGYLRSVGQFQ